MALAAGAELFGEQARLVENLVLERALFASDPEPPEVRLSLARDGLFVVSGRAGGDAPWVLHAHGRVRNADGSAAGPSADDLGAARIRCDAEIPVERFYANLAQRGLAYGASFRGITDIRRHGAFAEAGAEAVGKIVVTDEVASDPDAYAFHPAILDACLQVAFAAMGLESAEIDASYLPTRVERVAIHKKPCCPLWSHACIQSSGGETVLADVRVYDQTGEPTVDLLGIRLTRLTGATRPAPDIMGRLYEQRWQEVGSPAAATKENLGTWLILADRAGIGEELAVRLRSRGHRCHLVAAAGGYRVVAPDRIEVDSTSGDQLARATRALLASSSPGHRRAKTHVVHLWNLDSRLDGAEPDRFDRSFAAGCSSILDLLRAIDTLKIRPARFWVVTFGAQPAGPEPRVASPEQSAAWGLCRSTANEHPGLAVNCVDLGDPKDSDEIEALTRELCGQGDRNEVAIRNARYFVPHLAPWSTEPLRHSVRRRRSPHQFVLETAQPGVLDSLTPRATARRPPAPDEVAIEVVAAGLNFKDVMLAMDLLPRAAIEGGFSEATLGMECSGRVVAVGETVARFGSGDEVVALSRGCFASATTTREVLVLPKPDNLTFEQAAGIPVAYLTAYHALIEIARMSRGDRVLIHSASGGVGLAAVALARMVGAQIFATAGSEEKRRRLQDMGIHHVMDSRTAEFADRILEATEGLGVDIVLNSLTGPLLLRSIDVLARHGRFVELGKTAVYGGERIRMASFGNNQSYSIVDLDRLLADKPDYCGRMLSTVFALIEHEELAVLPTRTFGGAEAAQAFRSMTLPAHTGKVVLDMSRVEPADVAPAGDVASLLDSEASYLVTGGTSGAGLATAEWLASRGAQHLVLLSRHGPATPEDAEAIRRIRQKGVHVADLRVDVTDRAGLAAVIDDCGKGLPPLRGVVHCAAMLADAPTESIDHESLMKVVGPKARGAWLLHELTKDHQLDFFVLFSSIASLWGNPGQANYAAANAFLDSFSTFRQCRGLPATTVSWGVIGETGQAARNPQVMTLLRNRGWKPLSTQHVFESLEAILPAEPAHVIAAEGDWMSLAPAYPATAFRFSGISEGLGEKATADARSENALAGSLRDLDAPDRVALLANRLREQIARIIGAKPERIDVRQGLDRLGFDSLMAGQLRNWIGHTLDCDVPILEILRGPTVEELAASVARAWTDRAGDANKGQEERAAEPGQATQEPGPSPGEAAEMLERLEDLSDEEVEAALRRFGGPREGAS
jgi:NADPH:quinone reductase-like Zn-dependent oxidoreductase